MGVNVHDLGRIVAWTTSGGGTGTLHSVPTPGTAQWWASHGKATVRTPDGYVHVHPDELDVVDDSYASGGSSTVTENDDDHSTVGDVDTLAGRGPTGAAGTSGRPSSGLDVDSSGRQAAHGSESQSVHDTAAPITTDDPSRTRGEAIDRSTLDAAAPFPADRMTRKRADR